jgi:hypothetical protein
LKSDAQALALNKVLTGARFFYSQQHIVAKKMKNQKINTNQRAQNSHFLVLFSGSFLYQLYSV